MQNMCWRKYLQSKIPKELTVLCIQILLSYSIVLSQQNVADSSENHSTYKSMLDTIISQAVDRNPDLHVAQYKTQANKSAVTSITYDSPRLSVEFYQSPITSFPNPFKDQMEIDYSVQQMILFPGKLGSMQSIEKNRAKMSEADIQTKKQELISLVRVAFSELYLVDRQVSINSENRVLMRNFIEIARRQYELGIGRQTDILRAQTELSRLISDSISISQNRQSVVAMLNFYRNMPVETAIETVPEIFVKSVNYLSLDSLFTIADRNRPELKSMKYNIDMQNSELASAKKEWYPDFEIKGTYKQMLMGEKDDWSIMLGANLPIAPWSYKRYYGNVNKSQAMINQAQAEYSSMHNMIASQVKDAFAKVISSKAQVELLQNTTLPQAQQTVHSAASGYQNGTQEFLMLLDAQRMLLMTQLDYHTAVMSFLTNQVNLERAIGLL